MTRPGNPTPQEKAREQEQWATSGDSPMYRGYDWGTDPNSDDWPQDTWETTGFHAASGDTGGFVQDSQTNGWEEDADWYSQSGWGDDS